MKPLAPLTLGPAFSTHTPESFHAYVTGLKEIKNLGKEVKFRAPRIKKEPLKHDLNLDNGRCNLCNRRVRNVRAHCSGVPKEAQKRKKLSDEKNCLPLNAKTVKTEDA